MIRCRPLTFLSRSSKRLSGRLSIFNNPNNTRVDTSSFPSPSCREFHHRLPLTTKVPVVRSSAISVDSQFLDEKENKTNMHKPVFQPIRNSSHLRQLNQSLLVGTTCNDKNKNDGNFTLAHHRCGIPTFQNDFTKNHDNQHYHHHRHISSSAITDLIPEFAKQYSIWGGSAIILKTLHAQNIPYWACMSLTNVFVRTSLLPLVINGAKTSARFANVAPEVQFLVSNYTRDVKKLKDGNAPPSQRLQLLIATWQSLTGIYKLHGVNPLDVLKSPLMQIPVFWYFSVDIRKVINGGDPELAQELTENGFLWVLDLTEPDPWYGLPILSGFFLYLNVEMAVGRKTLSGETASKSNIARYLKDGFQSEYKYFGLQCKLV